MHVTIRLFARLRELAGASELAREVPEARPRATRGTRWSRSFPRWRTTRASFRAR